MLKKSYPRQLIAKGAIYFVTTKTKLFKPIFLIDKFAEMVCGEIKYLISRNAVKVFAYVIMPDHIHLLVEPLGDFTICQVVKLLKGRTARRINLARNASGSVWDSRFYSLIIDSEESFYDKIEYIMFNPVRAKLVRNPEDYEFLFVANEGSFH